MRPLIWLTAAFALSCAPAEEAPADGASLPPVAYGLPTTQASAAQRGLDAKIEGLRAGLDTLPGARPALMDALGLRLMFFGQVSDLDEIGSVAGDDAEQANAWLATHRFDEALAASAHVADSVALARHQGLESLAETRRDAVAQRGSTATWTALGDVLLAQGDAAGADRAYWEALSAYRDVSPLTVADLQFRRGLAWGESGEDPERARALYADAVRVLPTFVRAQVHLAELEWEAGEVGGAISRVRRVADSEDPEPGGKLAQWLTGDEAHAWQLRTTAAYDALLAKHPLAFANHGAEYFMSIGDVERARELAKLDLDNRATPRAQELCERAGCAR